MIYLLWTFVSIKSLSGLDGPLHIWTAIAKIGQEIIRHSVAFSFSHRDIDYYFSLSGWDHMDKSKMFFPILEANNWAGKEEDLAWHFFRFVKIGVPNLCRQPHRFLFFHYCILILSIFVVAVIRSESLFGNTRGWEPLRDCPTFVLTARFQSRWRDTSPGASVVLSVPKNINK